MMGKGRGNKAIGWIRKEKKKEGVEEEMEVWKEVIVKREVRRGGVG